MVLPQKQLKNLLGQVKEKVEGIGEATSQTIQSKMEKLTSDKTDADDEK